MPRPTALTIIPASIPPKAFVMPFSVLELEDSLLFEELGVDELLCDEVDSNSKSYNVPAWAVEAKRLKMRVGIVIEIFIESLYSITLSIRYIWGEFLAASSNPYKENVGGINFPWIPRLLKWR